MRTTLDLPEPLVQKAMKVAHQKTKTGVIVAALEDLVRKERIKGLKKFKGQIVLDIDFDKLRNRS